jgi:hypothetical protein
MRHRHKPIQSWSAQNGVEGEADLRDVEQDALRAKVLGRPESNRREIQLRGITDTGPTPENGLDG